MDTLALPFGVMPFVNAFRPSTSHRDGVGWFMEMKIWEKARWLKRVKCRRAIAILLPWTPADLGGMDRSYTF